MSGIVGNQFPPVNMGTCQNNVQNIERPTVGITIEPLLGKLCLESFLPDRWVCSLQHHWGFALVADVRLL